MKDEYVVLNNIQTHIITWGNPYHCNGQDIIVCISGNPGITDYYIEFASRLHQTTGLSVCVIGQAGHEIVPDNTSNVLRSQEHLFNLEGQILHKLELINNYIDSRSQLHLIGHSIGAWLILELLKDNAKLGGRVSSVNLLFPTLQRMADTVNGKYLNNVLRKCHVIVLLLLHLLSLLPTMILNFFIGIYLKLHSLPSCYLERTKKFLNPLIIEKVLFLAYNEMDNVKKLNIKVLDTIKHLTNVIYSDSDGWAPLEYMDDLKKLQPHLQLKQLDVEHAFVLKSSEKIADLVSEFIKTRIKLNK